MQNMDFEVNFAAKGKSLSRYRIFTRMACSRVMTLFTTSLDLYGSNILLQSDWRRYPLLFCSGAIAIGTPAPLVYPSLPIHSLPPPPSPYNTPPQRRSTCRQESRANCREPAHSNTLHGRQDHRTPQRRKHIPSHIIRRNDLRASTLHHIQTIRIQTRETHQLRYTLQKHHDHRQWDASKLSLHRPPIDEHADRYDDTYERESGTQSIFRDALAASFGGPGVKNMVGVAASEESADEVACTWG